MIVISLHPMAHAPLPETTLVSIMPTILPLVPTQKVHSVTASAQTSHRLVGESE